jgi:hypothetical protein
MLLLVQIRIRYFMGKFEVASGKTVTFTNGGTRYFRNGVGGDGTIMHPSVAGGAAVSCGNFMIGDNTTTQTATIDGSIKIIVQGKHYCRWNSCSKY